MQQPTAPAYAPAATTTPVLPKAPPPVGLESSGRGEEFFKNDAQNIWVVPVYGNVKNTLVLWARDIYPKLQGHENLIYSSASFNRVANILEQNLDHRSPNYLVVPPGYNKRIDIVNLFAGEVAAKLPRGEGNEQNI